MNSEYQNLQQPQRSGTGRSGDLGLAGLPVCAFGAFLNRNEYPTAHWTGPGVRFELYLEVHAFAIGTILKHHAAPHEFFSIAKPTSPWPAASSTFDLPLCPAYDSHLSEVVHS
jgi:hypothetical protein